MLEKQKKWCQEKAEKGKVWIEDHKLVIGCVIGVASTVLLYAIGNMNVVMRKESQRL